MHKSTYYSNIEEISSTFEWNLNRLSEFEKHFGCNEVNMKKQTNQLIHVVEKQEWFTPKIRKDEDLLFWTMYIMMNGEDAYSFFKNKTEVKRKMSFEWIEKFREDYKETKAVLRRHHLLVDDCINDLASSKYISLETFVSISIVLSVPVVLKKGHLLFDFSNNKKECYLFDVNRMERKTEAVNVLKMKNTHIIGKYLDKPFMSKTAYKRDDLVDMCHVLNIDDHDENQKRKPKDILWKEIMELYS